MAFNFGNSGNNAIGSPGGAAGIEIRTGPDLEDIQTEGLAFRALHGETKLQLLPTSWPANSLPPATASLLSINSQRGLLAAAGPDGVVGATTDSVRKAFGNPNNGDGGLVPFQPQLRLPMPMRISQLAFSADGSYLVLSAETGGGLAAYEVDALLQGSTTSAFELATNGKGLRMLLPNPTPEKAELFAVVTVDGELMMANLKERSFVTSSNGTILKTGVSCVSWSTKGKQLVAGLGDGTVYQLTPEGEPKGEIPRPPHTNADNHVSSITWLENHVFLLVHTPSQFDNSAAPQSEIHIATRSPNSKEFLFQKISDPTAPFGLNRSPPHHFILRLKEFPPNLQDLIILASTASTDIGLFSRSNFPLSSSKPAEKITGVFTMTEMSDDSGRAQLPMTADLRDTSPIGLVLDLSTKENVPRPIPGDEMDESATPLPAMMVLNNEGVLASWWIVYIDSVRQKTVYPGLVEAQGNSQAMVPNPSKTSAATSTFGGGSPQPNFGSSSFTKSAATGTFGNSTSAPTFDSLSLPGTQATRAFGAPSNLGAKPSLWGTPSTSSQISYTGPAFGSSDTSTAAFAGPATGKPAFGAPAFGSSALPGSRPSPWGSPAPASAFGQSTGLGKSPSIFGSQGPSSSGTSSSSAGFASFATKGGFGAASGTANPTTSIFGTQSSTNNFSALQIEKNSGSVFGGAVNTPSKSQSTAFGPSKFILGTTFEADNSAEGDETEAVTSKKDIFFGGTFVNTLGEAEMTGSIAVEFPESNEADMDNTDDMKEEHPKDTSTTPMTSPTAQRSHAFGLNQITSMGPAGAMGFSFNSRSENAQPGVTETRVPCKTELEVPKAAIRAILHPSTMLSLPDASKAKEQAVPVIVPPGSAKPTPEAPLPPDTTSKASYAAGESSISSIDTDAPLPHDSVSKLSSKVTESTKPDKALPRDFPPKSSGKVVELPASTSSTTPLRMPGASNVTPPIDEFDGPKDNGSDSEFVTEDECHDTVEGSDEGSGEDAADELSPISAANQSPGLTSQSSFGGPKTLNARANIFGSTQQPKSVDQPRPLFGEVNHSVPVLPPPKLQLSPRSPSPVRNAIPGRLLRPDASRSVSAPGTASALLASQGRMSRLTTSQPSATFVELQNAEEEHRARQQSEERCALVDDDEELMRKFLASEIKGTRTLDEFVAHSDYVGNSAVDSIPAQVEVVYRDMNSMIDTLGVNARALKSFIKGHTEQYKEQGRTREDLEDEEDWVFVEIEDLSVVVERTLGSKVQRDRLKDVVGKLETCTELHRDLARLRARCDDLKKALCSYSDSTYPSSTHGQPLTIEQAAQQRDLRKEFIKFQGLLSEAEEVATVLKAKVVSRAAFEGKTDGSAGPTVDAVLRTIKKMTGMAEKRSGDIDVLEGKMRKLHLSSGAGSRAGSPFATPLKAQSSIYGAPETPHEFGGNARGLQSSLLPSGSCRFGTSPPRKKISGFSAEDKEQLKMKLARRREVRDKLKVALESTGTHVKLMVDGD